MVTVLDLESIAFSVRDELDEVHGYCWPASKSLKKQLVLYTEAESHEVDIEEVLVGSSGRRHYVVAYPARYVEEMDVDGRIIIDVTLDQYSDENLDAGLVEESVEDEIDLRPVYIFRTKADAPYY